MAFHLGFRLKGGPCILAFVWKSLDLKSKTLTFQNGTSLRWDLLIGADGWDSRVRQAMESQEAGFSVTSRASGIDRIRLCDLPSCEGIEAVVTDTSQQLDQHTASGRFSHYWAAFPHSSSSNRNSRSRWLKSKSRTPENSIVGISARRELSRRVHERISASNTTSTPDSAPSLSSNVVSLTDGTSSEGSHLGVERPQQQQPQQPQLLKKQQKQQSPLPTQPTVAEDQPQTPSQSQRQHQQQQPQLTKQQQQKKQLSSQPTQPTCAEDQPQSPPQSQQHYHHHHSQQQQQTKAHSPLPHSNTYSADIEVYAGWQPPSVTADVEELLASTLPSVPEEWRQLAASGLVSQSRTPLGNTVRCSHLAIPWAAVALVGAAAHGTGAALGQATSAALETVAVLDKVLAGNRSDITTGLSEFNRVRGPDVKALHTLDRIAPHLFGGSGNFTWPWIVTLANIWVSGTLNRLLPRVWTPPATIAGLTSSTVSYRQILWRRQRDLGVLVCFVMATCAAALRLATLVVAS